MRRQSHFIGGIAAHKIVDVVSRSDIVADRFHVNHKTGFHLFIQTIIDTALIEIHMVPVNKIVQTAQRHITAPDFEQLYLTVIKSLFNQSFMKQVQVIRTESTGRPPF